MPTDVFDEIGEEAPAQDVFDQIGEEAPAKPVPSSPIPAMAVGPAGFTLPRQPEVPVTPPGDRITGEPLPPWQAFRGTSVGQKLFGPPPAELEAMGGVAGSRQGVIPTLAATMPMLPIGLEGMAGKALMGYFTADFIRQQPEIFRQAKAAYDLGDWSTLKDIVVQDVFGGTMMAVGAKQTFLPGKELPPRLPDIPGSALVTRPGAVPSPEASAFHAVSDQGIPGAEILPPEEAGPEALAKAKQIIEELRQAPATPQVTPKEIPGTPTEAPEGPTLKPAPEVPSGEPTDYSPADLAEYNRLGKTMATGSAAEKFDAWGQREKLKNKYKGFAPPESQKAPAPSAEPQGPNQPWPELTPEQKSKERIQSRRLVEERYRFATPEVLQQKLDEFDAQNPEPSAPAPPAAPVEPASAAAPAPAETPAAKEPWQMTRKQWLDSRRQEVESKIKDAQNIKDEASRKAVLKTLGDQLESATTGKPVRVKVTAQEIGPRGNPQNITRTITRSDVAKFHRLAIEDALREGNPVPPEVLADYPDIAKPAAAEFRKLVQEHGMNHGWIETPDVLIDVGKRQDTQSIKGGLRRDAALKVAYKRALKDIGLPEEANAKNHAAALPKLKAFLDAHSKLQPVPLSELPDGSEFTILGEKYKVKSTNPDTGIVTIEDGRTLKVDERHTVGVDPGSLKAKPVSTEFLPNEETPKVSKLRPGEKGTGDLLQAEAPFNLAGEKGTDLARIAAEKAAAAKSKAEGEAIAAKQQQDLFNKPAAPAPGAASLVNPPETGLEAGAGVKIPGLEKFTQEDVIPALGNIAKTFRETGAQIRNALSPPSAGPEARLGAGIIREHRAKLAQQDVQAREQFSKARATMEKLPQADALAFIDGIESGANQPTPAMDALAKDLRAGYAPRIAAVQAVNPKALQHLLQDYFPHIWKDPEAAVSWYARILGRRPLRGPASFLKQRTIPTTADGVAAGLEPVTYNPVELTLLKYHEMDRYVMGQKIFQDFKDKGLAEFSRSDIPPEGKTKINDRIANVIEYRPTVKADGSPGAPERVLRGHWYVQEDAARVLNNFLSPGLERFQWFRALRWIGNNINMAQLGLSGYHFNFTMIDSATSKLSLGIEQTAQGKLKGAATMARGVAGVPVANQLEYYLKGSKVLQEYTRPGSVGGDYARIVDGLIAAGGRTEMPKIFKNSSLENFTKSLRAGNYPGAVLRAPFAAIEAVSYPLMQNIVPRLKLGAFSDMARSELQRLGPTATRDQLRSSMGKVWDSVDNRMGELVYDNLFWNRSLKDLSFLAVRAVGWNLGTIRELGGGVLDSAKIISRARAGDPVITKRMAYLVALPITVGIMGGLYQKLKTGKNPETLRDYFYPLTGQTLPDGTPERVNFPSYLKDIGSYSRHPLVTIGHKLHPLWSTVIDMLNNKDFYGAQIRNPDDPLVKQAGQEMSFLAKTFIPFSVRGAQRRAGSKESLEPQAESFMGIMPISPELARTPAQNKIMEYAVARMPQGAKTPEQQARYELSKETNQLLQDPHDLAKAKAQLLAQQKAGTLSKGQRLYQASKLHFESQQMNLGNSKSAAQWLWRFKHLDLTEAQHAYDLATPAEQKLFTPELKRKRVKAGLKPVPTQDVFDSITE